MIHQGVDMQGNGKDGGMVKLKNEAEDEKWN